MSDACGDVQIGNPVISRYLTLRLGIAPPVGNPGALRDRWWAWHLRNPAFFETFEERAFWILEAGQTRFSAGVIAAGVLFDKESETSGHGFKMSREFIGMFARYFMFLYPQHEGFFAARAMKR